MNKAQLEPLLDTIIRDYAVPIDKYDCTKGYIIKNIYELVEIISKEIKDD